MVRGLERLDRHLQQSEYDSQDWADGHGAELAAEALAELSQEEWDALQRMVSARAANWRACLASVLRPQLGEGASKLLIQLSADSEIDVAFTALRGVAFYCGVNHSASGPFLSARTVVPEFLKQAKETDVLLENIQRVSVQCHPYLQRELDLLVGVVANGP